MHVWRITEEGAETVSKLVPPANDRQPQQACMSTGGTCWGEEDQPSLKPQAGQGTVPGSQKEGYPDANSVGLKPGHCHSGPQAFPAPPTRLGASLCQAHEHSTHGHPGGQDASLLRPAGRAREPNRSDQLPKGVTS